MRLLCTSKKRTSECYIVQKLILHLNLLVTVNHKMIKHNDLHFFILHQHMSEVYHKHESFFKFYWNVHNNQDSKPARSNVNICPKIK